jgi:hypothetical protein
MSSTKGWKALPPTIETRVVVEHPDGGSPLPGSAFQARAKFAFSGNGGLTCRMATGKGPQLAGVGGHEELKGAVLGRVRVGVRRVDAGTVALVVEAPPPGARPDALLQPAKKANPRAAPRPPGAEPTPGSESRGKGRKRGAEEEGRGPAGGAAGQPGSRAGAPAAEASAGAGPGGGGGPLIKMLPHR